MSDDITVRLTDDAPARIRGNGETWRRGETRTVSQERADALIDAHDYVEIVDDAAPNAEGEEAFDTGEWLDQDYEVRAERVEAGEVDAHLEAIAEAETSDNVLDAIGVRRAELEE